MLNAPNVLQFFDGKEVDKNNWLNRKQEILEYFSENVYGKISTIKFKSDLQLIETGFFDSEKQIKREQYELSFTSEAGHFKISILYYCNAETSPKHFYLGLNFQGNQTVFHDTQVFINQNFVREFKGCEAYLIDHHLSESSRGIRSYCYPIKEIVSAGYGFMTAYYGDICLDDDIRCQNSGFYSLFKNEKTDWGAISTWAWGLDQIIKSVNNHRRFFGAKAILFGHSRLGKTALWSGALYGSAVGVISNQSGCLGAKLGRYKEGETYEEIRESFPHWFCSNFSKYSEDNILIDQHCLIAALAPLPCYVSSATKDLWASPKGQFLAMQLAKPVYELYYKFSSEYDAEPEIGKGIYQGLGYHNREGAHSLLVEDWAHFIKWSQLFFK